MASLLFGSAEGIEFGPPPEKRSVRAFALAVLAHLLLLGALTWGVNWKRSDQTTSFEAELWSSLAQQAAPRAVEPPPPPPPVAPMPPAPTPTPAPKAPEAPKVSPAPDVDIALEQEKKRKLLEQKKEAEAAERKKEKALAEKAKEKELKAKEALAQRKDAEEAKKQEAKDLDKLQQQKLAEAAAKKRRDDAMKRVMGMAGATGGAEATGTAQRSSGPSASYGGKVRAKVKPNVLFTDDIVGNPSAEVEVRTTPDGTIVGQRLVKSSGNKAWDDAVIKAIIRTETMPRDVDGKVPTPMILEFRPKELL